MNYFDLVILGAIAGFTIFLGIPVALMKISAKRKALLSAVSIGILFFLIIEVFEHAWEAASDSIADSLAGKLAFLDGFSMLLAVFLGAALGLVGLALYEQKFMRATAHSEAKLESSMAGKGSEVGAYALATLIAIGIGVHNLSEGLAIGQSYASGVIGLAVILIIGFALHNATEGFGIIGPLAGSEKKPSKLFLLKLGLIAGGPTFVGTIIGSFWVSPILNAFFLAFAGGALIFVSLLMYSVALKQTKNSTIMMGIFIGLAAGFLTELVVSLAGA